MRILRPVPFPERVGNVHLHIFFHDLFKGGLGHLLNAVECRFQIEHRSKPEVSLGQVDGADFSGEVVDFLKENPVDLLERRNSPGCKLIQPTAFIELHRFLLADALLFPGQVRRAGQSQFVFQCHGFSSLSGRSALYL